MIWSMSVHIEPVKGSSVQFRAHFNDDERLDVDVTLHLTISEAGRPWLERVEVVSRGVQPIGTLEYRAVPVGQLVRESVMSWRAETAGGPVDEVLVAAEVHRLATKAGEDPLRAVAVALGVGRTTAASRVREARLAGHLPNVRVIRRRSDRNDQRGRK
jgi:hypothetical protein